MQGMNTSIRTFQYLVSKLPMCRWNTLLSLVQYRSKLPVQADRTLSGVFFEILVQTNCTHSNVFFKIVHKWWFIRLLSDVQFLKLPVVLFLNKCTDCAFSNVLLKIVQKCRGTRTSSNVLFSKLLMCRWNTFFYLKCVQIDFQKPDFPALVQIVHFPMSC